MDAFRLIERYNNPDTLMYLDPPYVMSSRKSGKLYSQEFTNEDQIRLLDLITSSKAKIVISGYESALYDEALKDWRRDSTMSQTTSTEMAMEVIWMNYEPPNEQLTWEELEL